MSEYTPDDLTDASSTQPDEELAPAAEISSQATKATSAEEDHTTNEEQPSVEQPVETGAVPGPENTLPPEAQGEANGGPLGCCLGTMVGLLLSLTLAIFSRVYAESLVSVLQGNYWLLGLLVRILMGILAFALAVFFGYVGWGLGRRFYREYEPPVLKRRSREKKGKPEAL